MVRGSVRKDPGTSVIAELIYDWIKDPRISGGVKIVMQTVNLEFHGPLAWVPSDDAAFIFDSEISKNPGIYLWTVETSEGHLIWYVGQTRTSFHQRMKEHFKEQMSGSYEVYDPVLLAQGERKRVWPGYYGRKENRRIPEFLDEMPFLCAAMVELAKITRFFVAPMEGDRRLHRRVEGGIGRYLREQPGVVGEYIDKALRYESPRFEGEDPLELSIKCPRKVRGMPNRLEL